MKISKQTKETQVSGPPARPAFFIASRKGDFLKQKVFQTLKSEKGEASYIGTFVYILVAAIMIAFIINVFQVISVKQQMDHLADQLVKQIQLNGGGER